MSEKNRIEKIILQLNMTSSQFAAEIGVQNSTLSHILNNRNNPSLDVLKKILSRFTEVSADWLILGQGSMMRLEKHSKEPTLFDSIDENSSTSMGSVQSEALEKASAYSFNQNEMLNNRTEPVSHPIEPVINRHSPVNNEHTPISAVYSGNVDNVNKPTHNEIQNRTPLEAPQLHLPVRKVDKVILYFSDNTFQEFDSK